MAEQPVAHGAADRAVLKWKVPRRGPVNGVVRPLSFMAIPDADRAVVEDAKVRDYLLNLEHPDGGSKAIWFHSLGYDRNEWQCLAADLLAIAQNCTAFHTETTAFGVKYKALGAIGRPEFRAGVVLTVWIVEDDDPPRLVTAYPE